MDHGEIFQARGGNRDARNGLMRDRQGGEKREGKMPHRVAKFSPVGSIPGINRIELRQLRRRCAFDHPHQVEPGIEDRAGAVGKPDQRQNRARRPDLGVIGPRRFQLRKR